jgi:hypothetical protein
MSLQDQFLQVLHSNQEDGVSDNDIKLHFGDSYTELVPIVNELLRTNHIQLFTSGDLLFYRSHPFLPEFWYLSCLLILFYSARAVEEKIAARLEGLGYSNFFLHPLIPLRIS